MDKKISADAIALKLEKKAIELRKNGLSQDDMDAVQGGFWFFGCCGSSCTASSDMSLNGCEGSTREEITGSCVRSCVSSSPD